MYILTTQNPLTLFNFSVIFFLTCQMPTLKSAKYNGHNLSYLKEKQLSQHKLKLNYNKSNR